jgi:hypothetical protein
MWMTAVRPQAYTQPPLRFSGGWATLQANLKATIPQAIDFLNGQAFVVAANGQPVAVRLSPTTAQDVAQVMDWYAPQPDGSPSYADNPKWQEWWEAEIAGPNPTCRVLKLAGPQNEIYGVVAYIPQVYGKGPPGPMTWLEGIRIAPKCNSMMTPQPALRGVGSALVTQAVVESVRHGDAGLGLNSTLGAEDFYKSLKMNSQPALDGIRTCFTLMGEPAREGFLKRRFEAYQRYRQQA